LDGGTQNELVPRLVQGLAGKKVIGAAAGADHTVVWTDAGEVFTFGLGFNGQLGHGRDDHDGGEDELVPRLVVSFGDAEV